MTTSTRPSTTRRTGPSAGDRVSMTLDAILAVTALGGGLYMATHPDTMMPLEYLEGTPFSDWLLPGIALALVNGVWPLLALALTWRGARWAPLAQCAVGLTLMAWLLLQIPLVGYVTMFQAPYTLLAATLVAVNFRPLRQVVGGPPKSPAARPRGRRRGS